MPKLTAAARRELAEQKRAGVKPVKADTPSAAPPPPRPPLPSVPIIEWHGAYDDSWRGQISPESFAHPAKASRGLLKQIYDYLFEQGALVKGSTIVDPFGGIGTTALEGAWRGCHVVCVELEPKFRALTCANLLLHAEKEWCTCGREGSAYLRYLRDGISNVQISRGEQNQEGDDSMVLFQGVLEEKSSDDKIGPRQPELERRGILEAGRLHRNSGEWQAEIETRPSDGNTLRQITGEERDSSSQRRRQVEQRHDESRDDDYLRAHEATSSERSHMHGNRENLPSVQENILDQTTPKRDLWGEGMQTSEAIRIPKKVPGEVQHCPICGLMSVPFPLAIQGDSRQLRTHVRGAISAIVSSPPYEGSINTNNPGGIDWTKTFDGKDHRGKGDESYGETDGQLGAMPSGDVAAIIASPPYADQGLKGGDQRTALSDPSAVNRESGRGKSTASLGQDGQESYGHTDGQLGAMASGDVAAIIASPPYSKGLGHGGTPTTGSGKAGDVVLDAMQQGYGKTDGQLERMSNGDVDVIVSSPPYAEIASGAGGLNTKPGVEGQQSGRSAASPSQQTDQRYGDADGQLAKLPKGEVEAIIASPPYSEGCTHTGGTDPHPEHIEGGKTGHVLDTYGQSDGQLADLKSGDVDVVISSPPYADLPTKTDDSSNPEAKIARLIAEGQFEAAESVRRDCSGPNSNLRQDGYGNTDGQLASLDKGSVDALVSSPPYADISQSGGIEGLKKYGTGLTQGGRCFDEYGETEGQLGRLSSSDVDAIVTSRPYEGSIQAATTSDGPNAGSKAQQGVSQPGQNYGRSDGQIGTEIGETFWSASLQIVRECHALLKSGGSAVWIVKSFVRDKAIVDFPGDWRKLCEHVGFETVTEIHAMLVKETVETDLFGEETTAVKERKSFFRRLAEKKGSPRIDYEVVWVMKKP